MIIKKGNRGIVEIDEEKGIVVKRKNPSSTAIARIEIEAEMLKKVNTYGIGPRFISFHDGELMMEFIDGELFEEYIAHASKKQREKVIREIENQLEALDRLGINKAEMTRPRKHIIIRQGKPVLIDFERAKYSHRPQNMAQFREYRRKLGLGAKNLNFGQISQNQPPRKKTESFKSKLEILV